MTFFIIVEDVKRGILSYTYIGQVGPERETTWKLP